MLPLDIARCAGRAPFSGDTCSRKNECARYLAQGGPQSPFYLSVCEEGEAYIHADTVPAESPAGHPADRTANRVLCSQPAVQDRG